MGLFDDLFNESDSPVATETPPEPAPTHNGHKAPASKHAYLYLDLETVPDYERMDQFDLPKLPPHKDKDLLSAKEFCSQTLGEIEQFFERCLPPDSWLEKVESEERAAKKPRQGLFKAVEKVRGLVDAQRKTLSVTPEFCRIVAAAWAIGGGEIESKVLADRTDEFNESELSFLTWFWKTVAHTRTIVGYNCLHFDLPVILIRSALLGVTPSRRIDLSPYRNNQVCDLFTARWPKGAGSGMKLKSLARALGIEIPADDCDGSQVESLYKTDPEKLKAYVESDIHVTRELHRLLSGYFFD